MIVELISTGSELLLGDTINTNVAWLAREMNKLGYTVAFQSTIGDNPARMEECFRLAASRADLVVCTGGLGPTQGDIPGRPWRKPSVWNSNSIMTQNEWLKPFSKTKAVKCRIRVAVK